MAEEKTKICPRCGAVLFADIDACYDCMYGVRDPSTSENREASGGARARGHATEDEPLAGDGLPERGDSSLPRRRDSGLPERRDSGLPERSDSEGWDGEEVPIEAYVSGGGAALDKLGEEPVTELFGIADSALATEEEPVLEPPARWELRLCCKGADLNVPVPEGGLLVGRGASCDIVLHARSVSRQHVHIEPDANGVFVRDLGARNPPTLNGRRLAGEAHMQEGDTLSICGTTLTLFAHGAVPAPS